GAGCTNGCRCGCWAISRGPRGAPCPSSSCSRAISRRTASAAGSTSCSRRAMPSARPGGCGLRPRDDALPPGSACCNARSPFAAAADRPVTGEHQDLQANMCGEPGRPLFPSEIDITFFVPCYNEEENVRGAIDKLAAVAATLKLSHEVIVFDDCSQDGTAEVVRAYQREHPDAPVQLVTCAVNQGVSRNFVEGAFRGRGRYYRLGCGDAIEPIEPPLGLARRIGEGGLSVPYSP